MITPKMQTVAIIAVIVFFVILVWLLRKNRMELRYALLWFFCGIIMMVLAVFPDILDWFSRLVGIYSSVNALFAVTLFFALLLILSLTSIVSREKQEVVRLIQELAVLVFRPEAVRNHDFNRRNRIAHRRADGAVVRGVFHAFPGL